MTGGRSLVNWSLVISGGVVVWLAGTLYLMAKRNSWGLADRVRV
ncbi:MULTISPECIES: hypothetical protein [Acetobacter]|uniref:Uncharacterized protein n=1 Tax=Acetobacter lovaniensis TaxID=104100 RepID=A0A841QB96_9PROT|nr:hypothetical protein [Acetobacter lovaniensis]MBB6455472.1 hypothetical protein [Acetobacter lovaniensis]